MTTDRPTTATLARESLTLADKATAALEAADLEALAATSTTLADKATAHLEAMAAAYHRHLAAEAEAMAADLEAAEADLEALEALEAEADLAAEARLAAAEAAETAYFLGL